MTSRKSSTKTTLYDLRNSFKTSWAIPLLLLGWNLFITAITVITNLYHNSISKDPVEYFYYFFDQDFVFSNITLFPIYIASVICGIMAFGFINSKKQTNVYLSLNITRTKLMKNRFIAYISMLSASICASMLILLIANLIFVGFSSEMMLAWLYLTAGLIVSALAVFSITALAMVCAGGLTEGLLYTLIFVFLPTIAFNCVNYICEGLLVGFPRSVPVHYSPTIFDGSGSFLYSMNTLNPLLFFDKAWNGSNKTSGIVNYGTLLNGEKLKIGFDSVYPILIWLALSVIILSAAIKVFNLRKAENAGSFGKNAKAKAVTVTSLCVLVFSFFVTKISSNIALAIGLGAVAAIIVYFALEFTILRSFRDVKHGLKKLPIIFAIIALILIVPITGAFGYANKIPKASEISKAYIGAFAPDVFMGNNYLSSNDARGPFVSESDIKTVISIHKLLKEEYSYSSLESPNPEYYISTTVKIRYDLKNGSTIIRKYNIPESKIKDVSIAYGDTDYTKDYMTTLLTVDDATAEENYLKSEKYLWAENATPEQRVEALKWNNISQTFRTNNFSSAYLAPPDLISATPHSLGELISEEDFIILKKCLLEDYLAMGTEKRLYSDEEILGVIIVDSHMDFKQNLSHPDATTDITGYNTNIIQLTKSMAKTIEFLEAKEMMDYFKSTKKIVSAAILTAEILADNGKAWSFMYWEVSSWNHISFHANLNGKSTYYINDDSQFPTIDWNKNYKNAGITQYTDEATIAKLRSRASLQGFENEKKEILNLVFEDGSFILMPITKD